MVIEVHAHTSEHYCCSRISASDLIRIIQEKGLGGVVLTDHHYLWSEEELQQLRIDSDIADDFLILSGQEVFTRDFGDVLVFGAMETIPRGVTLSSIRERHIDAAIVWAHPYRSGQVPMETELFNAKLDAIEIINPRQKDWENNQGKTDWQTWGFIATSGSDIHDGSHSEFYPTCLKTEIKDIWGLVASIRGGLCRPVVGKFI